MTDLSPNDLSHLSDTEFQSLCPQGYHAPGPEPLSPAAQAVMDAAFPAYDDEALYVATGEQHAGLIAAAALRAAADQIAPTKQNYFEASDLLATTCLNGMAYAANELRLIATELENLQ
jgi:hypothetical protein